MDNEEKKRDSYIEILDSGITYWLKDSDWHPSNDYILIVGEYGTVLKYDEKEFKTLIVPTIERLDGIGWRNGGEYCLIVGNNGTVLRYDGITFVDLSLLVPTNEMLFTVSWKPNNDYALIGGENNTLLKYNGKLFEKISIPENCKNVTYIFDIVWKKDGSMAFLSGWSDNYESVLLSYDGSNIHRIEILSHKGGGFNFVGGVDWNEKENLGYMVGNSGYFSTFSVSKEEDMQSLGTDSPLWDIEWNHDYKRALIAGGLIGSRYNSYSTLIEYENGETKFFEMDINYNLFNISWKNDDSGAIIVGRGGTVIKYYAKED